MDRPAMAESTLVRGTVIVDECWIVQEEILGGSDD